MDWYLTAAVALVAVGAVLLAAEFLLPTGGVLVVGGVAVIAAAVVLVLLHGSTAEAVASVVAVSVGVPLVLAGLFAAWQRTLAIPGADGEAASATVADAPEIAGLDRLKGRFGRTVSPMRPAGAVDFDGRRVDALSDGPMVDAGVWVKCVGVRAGRVVVRRIDTPPDLADLPADGLT